MSKESIFQFLSFKSFWSANEFISSNLNRKKSQWWVFWFSSQVKTMGFTMIFYTGYYWIRLVLKTPCTEEIYLTSDFRQYSNGELLMLWQKWAVFKGSDMISLLFPGNFMSLSVGLSYCSSSCWNRNGTIVLWTLFWGLGEVYCIHHL